MRSRSLIILAAVAIVMGVFIFFVERHQPTTDERLERADRRYRILKAGDRPRAGVLQNPFEGERPVWVNYIRVADPAALAAKVEGLGGRVLVEAQARPIGGKVALIAGPSGAGVALQTWPLD